jgi:hypothetical protein
MRWLVGNTNDSGDYDFSYYDVGKLWDIMEDWFDEISRNRELLLDMEYIMDMFAEIANKRDHLPHILSS